MMDRGILVELNVRSTPALTSSMSVGGGLSSGFASEAPDPMAID